MLSMMVQTLRFFRSDELEGLPGEYRLIRVSGDEIEPCE
jgi:hypothetical protein